MSENLGFFEIPVLDKCFKIRDFLTSVNSEQRKHGMFESLGFLKSKFSVFTRGEYRKHGFIKVAEK